MAHLSRACPHYYSIVIMYVSGIFNVKNGVTLKPGLDLSRLLKMVPFESLSAFSYSHSMVTMAISCIIFEIKRDRPKNRVFHKSMHSTLSGLCRNIQGGPKNRTAFEIRQLCNDYERREIVTIFRILFRMKCIICVSVQLNILPNLHKSSVPLKLHLI